MRLRRWRRSLDRSGPWIGVGGVVTMVWLAISTAIYAPWWGVVLHLLLIVPQGIVLARLARTAPRRCPLVPAAGFAAWAALNALGILAFNWRL